MAAAVSIPGKLERYGAIDDLIAQVTEEYDNREYENEGIKADVMKQVGIILHDHRKDEVRRLITEDKIRPDGRKIDEIRPLDSQLICYLEFMGQRYLHVVKRKFYRLQH